MDYSLEAKRRRMRQVLNLERPDCLPVTCNCGVAQYRPEFYVKSDPDQTQAETEKVAAHGQVRLSADGKLAYTRDGEIWRIGTRKT